MPRPRPSHKRSADYPIHAKLAHAPLDLHRVAVVAVVPEARGLSAAQIDGDVAREQNSIARNREDHALEMRCRGAWWAPRYRRRTRGG